MLGMERSTGAPVPDLGAGEGGSREWRAGCAMAWVSSGVIAVRVREAPVCAPARRCSLPRSPQARHAGQMSVRAPALTNAVSRASRGSGRSARAGREAQTPRSADIAAGAAPRPLSQRTRPARSRASTVSAATAAPFGAVRAIAIAIRTRLITPPERARHWPPISPRHWARIPSRYRTTGDTRPRARSPRCRRALMRIT